ncbi:MAG: phosphatidylglycerol lysyltransferase domain-containing protein [Fimbriimonadaceae bacterium]
MPQSPDTLKARELILKYGVNSACYQIVNDNITKFFPPTGESLVGFVKYHGIHVVATEPIGPISNIKEATTHFQQSHANACYFGASQEFTQVLAQLGPATEICIGSQPCWNLQSWNDTILVIPSLREQFRRARAKGVTIRELTTEEAQSHPQLQEVLQTWLKNRRFSPLHFLVEFDTLDFLLDRRIFVAERDGKIQAWLNLCPIPKRKGWLTEQFPRIPSAPNGTMELLLHTAAQSLASEGHEFLTMGLVPLSNIAIESPKPPWLQWAFLWARAHGKRFYNFQGLENFKSKFRPHHWEPLYAAVLEKSFRPQHLIAIARAFTQDPLIPTLLKGAYRSICKEVKWILKGAKH